MNDILTHQIAELQRQYYLLISQGYPKKLEIDRVFFDGKQFYFTDDLVPVTSPEVTKEIDKLFSDLGNQLLSLYAKGQTVFHLNITFAKFRRGKYYFPDNLIVDITPDLKLRNYPETWQIVNDLRRQLLDLDQQGITISYFDPQEIVNIGGRYQISPDHPFTNDKYNNCYLPKIRKFFIHDIYAPNQYSRVTIDDIWDSINLHYHLQGWRINSGIYQDLRLDYMFPRQLKSKSKPKVLPDLPTDLVIKKGNDVFVVDKIVFKDHKTAILQGRLDSTGDREMIAKITLLHLSKNPAKNLVQQSDFVKYQIDEGYKVYFNGKLTRYHCVVMEKLDPVGEPDIAKLARDIIANLYLMHRQEIAHCDVKPANIMKKDGNYVLIDFDSVVPANLQIRNVGTPEFAVYNLLASQHLLYGLASYRDDLIELGYTLNYFNSKGSTVRFSTDPRVDRYLNLLFTYSVDQVFPKEFYEQLIAMFS